MYQAQRYGGHVISPIKFSLDDKHEVKLLKVLTHAMTVFNPKERPSIDSVLQSIEKIEGNHTFVQL